MAQKKTLTDILLSTLKAAPGEERTRVLDARLPGFLVEVSCRHKRFVVRSRGRYKTLGRWPLMTVAEARAFALDFLRGLELSSSEAIRAAAHSTSAAAIPEREGPTLAEALAEYVGVKRLKARTSTDYQQCLGRYWSDYLEQPLVALDGDAVLARFRAIRSPAQANYSLRIIRAIFRFHNAAHDESLPIPTAKVLALEGAHSIAPRSRLVADDKQQVWHLAVHSRTGPNARDLFIFLACTGLRLGEALGLSWADIDLQGRSIIIHDTKNGKPHRLPLGHRIAALLEARRGPGVDASSKVFPVNQRNVRKSVARVE